MLLLRSASLFSLLLASVSSLVAAEDADAKWYPKSQSAMKAMLTLLAPSRDATDNMKGVYIQRLKMYRYVCDVPFADLTWDDDYANLAYHASAICSKLNKLTHTPEKPSGMSDEDYALGKKGAGQSNLFMGRTEPSSCVDGWMDDSDKSNIDRVGHRRWCLNPRMLKSAFGSVGKFAAMYAFDKSNKNVPDWDYVAFPTRGYMPFDMFGSHYAWSVSLNMGKYAKLAKDGIKPIIQPVDDKLQPVGSPLKIDYFNVDTGGFGSGPAIIFRPESVSLRAGACYKVTISGVKEKSGKPAELEYLVHFVDINKAPITSESREIITAYFRTRLDTINAMSDRLEQLEALSAYVEQDLLKSADPELAKTAKSHIADLMKDKDLKKEFTASMKYQQVVNLEKKAGDNKRTLVNVAATYRNFAKMYKGTRAATKAEADFERLKQELQ